MVGGRSGKQASMRTPWNDQILYELSKLEADSARGIQAPIELYTLYENMLGNARSDVGVQWDAAVQSLRQQGMITVDRAGYVVLTSAGRERVPGLTRRFEGARTG